MTFQFWTSSLVTDLHIKLKMQTRFLKIMNMSNFIQSACFCQHIPSRVCGNMPINSITKAVVSIKYLRGPLWYILLCHKSHL